MLPLPGPSYVFRVILPFEEPNICNPMVQLMSFNACEVKVYRVRRVMLSGVLVTPCGHLRTGRESGDGKDGV